MSRKQLAFPPSRLQS